MKTVAVQTNPLPPQVNAQSAPAPSLAGFALSAFSVAYIHQQGELIRLLRDTNPIAALQMRQELFERYSTWMEHVLATPEQIRLMAGAMMKAYKGE